jgi:TonB-linked SusC/RagA family outer membrane protein
MRKLFTALAAVLLFSIQLFAQKTVTGKVTDDKGNPIPNVSVVIKGTNTGTTTNIDGIYSLNAPQNATLVFSSIDMATQEVKLGSQTSLSVTLMSANKSMDEVVVTAYGSNIKRSSFTGSAAQVTGKQFENRPISNALNALVGAAPGIQTTTPSGAPGSSPGIIVRGFGSFSLSSGPLYVVDGAIYDGGFSNINPDDIETITVLKDASTTALYGSKGANGVIMITTKKAKKGRQTLQFKAQTGFSNPAIERYSTVTANEYYPLAWESYRNGLVYGPSNIPTAIASQIATGTLPRNAGGNQIYLSGQYQDIYQVLGKYNPYNVGNTDIVRIDGTLNPAASLLYADDLNWLDQASRTGTRNEFGVLFGSGSEKADFSASFNYLKEGGWGLRSGLSRFSGRVNANVTPTNWFKAGFNIAANRTKFNNSATGGIVNPFYFARYAAPIYPVHLRQQGTGQVVLDALGVPRFDYGNENGYTRPFNSGRHSIAEHLLNRDNDLRDVISARTYGEVIFAPWLKFTTNISFDVTNNESESYENPLVGDGFPSGRYSRGQSRSTSHTFNQLLNLNKKFGYHSLDVLLGHENYNNLQTGITGMRIGQSFDDIYVYSNFITINSLNSSVTENRSEGYFSRVNYDFANKYLLSASIRRDGNSRFPRDIRWANFWSIGAAWKIDEEKFFNVSWVDMLKLRASYGVTGNSETANYPYQAGYSIGFDDDTRPGVILSSLGSPALTWETQKPFDLGLDFSIFKNRLSGTIGYFIRNSSGLIFSVPQPLQNGGTNGGNFTISQNIGSMTNKGIEIQLTGNVIRKKDFNWTVTFNGTSYKNKLTKMPDITPVLTSVPFRREAGKSIYDFYTRTFYGVDPADGQALYLGAITYNTANSRLISNNKGGFDTVTIDHNNARQTYIGKSALPDWYGSLVNTISYKNFELGFVFTYQIGGSVYDGVYGSLMSTATAGQTYHTDIMKRWQKAGDITNVPRLDNTRTAQYGAVSTQFLTSATYFSLNNINFAYQIPAGVLSKIGATGARVFISAENVRFFTKRKGMNVNGNFSGQTGDTYDAARVINAGLSFNF